MCMKQLDAEKIFFDKLTVFNLAMFWQLHLVSNDW